MFPCRGLYILLLFAATESAKILFICHRTGKSHHIAFTPIVEGVARRKHDVTALTYFPFEHSGVKNLLLKFPNDGTGDPGAVQQFALNAYRFGSISQIILSVNFVESGCKSLLNNEVFQELLVAGKQFDVAIVDALLSECAVIAASLLARNIVYYYTGGLSIPWMNDAVPTPYAYVPNSMERLPSNMSFWQRMQNMVIHLIARYVQKNHVNAIQKTTLSRYLPNAPSIDEAQHLVDFSLVNGDPVTTSPRPSMPNIVYICAAHCRDATPLPKEFQDYLSDSGDYGFIVFSLGSILKSELMPAEFLESVKSAFSRLKQKVIWKFDGQLTEIPENVKIVKWMPQQNLLGHPNMRLFITHSGLLSLQEAIYHGVPVIGIPFYADQQGNIARIQELGIGELADFTNITADNFYWKIQKILNDHRYHDNARKYSAILKDQPRKAVDTAVYWIEYVINHDGARHFHSTGEDLTFFQYFLLDVLVALLLAAVTTFGVFTYFFKILFKYFVSQRFSVRQLSRKPS